MNRTIEDAAVTGGVDTHRDAHVAAVIDQLGRRLGVATFPANGAGYRALLAGMFGFGAVHCVGVEGTGSYGAGLARFLADQEVAVGRGQPSEPATATPSRQVRQHRRRGGRSCCAQR